MKYGVVFSHEKTYETYAEHAYELNKTALNAICLKHVIAVLTVLAAHANVQTHLPLRYLIIGLCLNTFLALAPLVMRVFYLNNKKAMQAYKRLAFVALLLLPILFARIHREIEEFKSSSPALFFVVHFGCYSMLLTDKFVAFLAEAILAAVAVFALEAAHEHHATHLIFEAFGMCTFIFLLYSWERTRRESFLIEKRLAKQMADNKEADAAARQLNNRRILHDLKTPLAALLQIIKKLLTNPKDADMKLAFALTELIKHHVLALNHSEGAPKVVKDVALKEHFTHLVSLYAPLCEAVEQTLRLVCPMPMSVTAYVPVDLLDRAIANLISNATKFTSPGGSIVLDCSQMAGKLIVEVRDTGKGVAEEERDKIWLAGHQSQTDAVGLGLGLPSVKAFAEGEGGEVWCHANPAAEGEGAAIGFSICVPFDAGDSSIHEEEETVCVEIRNEEEGARANTPRVLLVEDDPVQLIALKRSVTKELPNADIETATNGHEGLQRLRSSSFDAVLSDLLMPITDGATMLRQAKSEGRLPSFARILTYDTETASKLEYTSVPVQSKAPGIRAVVREVLLEWEPPSGDGATKEELAKKNALQCRVLLVEDDDLQLYFLRRRVQEELPNAIIETALNGREGLEHLLTCDYDALITDYNMPVMDGVQMLNEARAKQCLPRVAKLNSATTRTPEFLSSCGLNAEDVFDKCETSRDVVKIVARQLVKRDSGFGDFDDVRIELGASSSDSANSLGGGSKRSTKRLLSRVASTSSPKDVRDVAEILEDSTVLKGLKERHGALSDAITRGDAQSIKAIVHKLRGWAMSLQAHDLVSACAAYQDDPDRVEDVLSCLDGMAGPDVGDSA